VECDAGGGSGFGLASLGFVSTDFEMLTGRPPTSVRQLLESTLTAIDLQTR